MVPLKPTGFWSYTSADDAASDGRLSRLRRQLANRLQQRVGQKVHLFQDVAAIPPGTAWEEQIDGALGEASFLVPILTPGFLRSEWCMREVRRFREVMQARGRNDLILPIHYLDVMAFQTVRRGECFDPETADYLFKLQWVDFCELEPRDSETEEVRVWLAGFAGRIEEALYRETQPPKPAVAPLPVVVAAPPPAVHPKPTLPGPSVGASPMPSPARRWKLPAILSGGVGIAGLALVLYLVGTPSPPTTPTGAAAQPSAAEATPARLGQLPVIAGQPAPVARLPAGRPAVPPQPASVAAILAAVLPAPPPPAALSPGQKFREPNCPECPEMVVLPAGRFIMGSDKDGPNAEPGRSDDEGPAHEVAIRSFAVGRTDVTRGEFAAFVRATNRDTGSKCNVLAGGKSEERDGLSWRNPGFPQDDSHPVACVSWEDADAYVNWLNGRVAGQPYRLLTEAEWEYAARAQSSVGKRTEFYTGAKVEPEQAQYNWSYSYAGSATRANGATGTAPVANLSSNGFGLYDMHGNLWQWVRDCYRGTYSNAPRDGSSVEENNCSLRVLRGGSWTRYPGFLRSANRGRSLPGLRDASRGFRVARTL